MSRTVCRAALVALLLPSALHAQSAEAVLDRAVAAYQRMKTARATFEQTLTNPLTGSTMTARGTFVQQRKPARLAVRFSDPEGDRIVSDGKAVWVYTPSTAPGQVLRLPAREVSGTVDIADQFFASPKTRYDFAAAGTATISGRKTHAVTLTPKAASAPFTTATVWIDDANGVMRQFEMTEPSGLVRKVRIVTLALNAKVRGSDFTFTPPDGVKVFDQAAP